MIATGRRRIATVMVAVAVISAAAVVPAAPVTAQTGVGGIVNGGFETGTFAGWSTHRSTGIVSPGRTGSFAAQAGPANGESWIQQTFTAPPGGRQLSFWYAVTCAGSVASNHATATLRDDATGTTTTVLPPTCVADSGWQQVTVPLTPGRTYTLRLINVRGTAAATTTRFDDVAVHGLTVTYTADQGDAAPGETVGYTITASNPGNQPLTGASVTAGLAGVLDDADYNNDAAASTGTVGIADQELAWTGDLAAGATVTISYSVTVARETGDRQLTSSVSSPIGGSNCAAGSDDPRCSVQLPVTELTIEHTADAATALPGEAVEFTTVVANTGEVPYFDGELVVDATQVYDDAVPSGTVAASAGTVFVTDDGWLWSGPLPVGAEVTITASVLVLDPPPPGADGVLTEEVTSDNRGSNCPPGGADPRCVTEVAVTPAEVTVSASADLTVAAPGETVTYTIDIDNLGEYEYPELTVTDTLTGVLDDAAYNDDAEASAGELSYEQPVLTWTGELPVSDSVTISYTVTVDEDPATGDKLLVNQVESAAVGSSCPPAAAAAGCQATVTVLTPALTIEKSADAAAVVVAGEPVSYTVTATNTGQLDYDDASFADDLSELIDDGTYQDDATADIGAVELVDDSLVWAGELLLGETVTVTYTVVADDPPGGDQLLSNVVSSETAGSNCPPASSDPRCFLELPVVGTVALEIDARADQPSVAADGTVEYTVAVTNTEPELYESVEFGSDLADLLDDAAYNDDVAASIGTASVAGGELSWSGDLPSGQTATITFSVTVTDPPGGDGVLAATVVSGSPGNNCPPGGADPRCSVRTTVSELELSYAADVSTTTPGGVVGLTATLDNLGQTPYVGLTALITLDNLLDDAVAAGDLTSSAGALQVTEEGLTWRGDLPVGESVTVSGSVTVSDPATGNRELTSALTSDAEGSNCPTGDPAPECVISVPVQLPELAISKTAEPGTAAPGEVVDYTIEVSNPGEVGYDPATITDNLADVLDDADYNDDAAASSGQVTVDDAVLTWTGELTPTETVTISYSVTVADDPQQSGRVLTNVVSTTDPGSDCPPGSPAAECAVAVPVLTPALTISKSADVAEVPAGEPVSYTMTVTNTGQLPYPAASVVDDLSSVQDDGAYQDDATADIGTVELVDGNLVWTGDLAVGAAATVTYTVVAGADPAGDQALTNVVGSDEVNNNCPDGGDDPRCTVTVPILLPDLSITFSVPYQTAVVGQVVPYTLVLDNDGSAPVTDVSVTGDLAEVLDDAMYNNDAEASQGEIVVDTEAETVVWTGDVAPDELVEIGYSVTIDRPATGTERLSSEVTADAPGSNCPPDDPAAECQTEVLVEPEFLTITELTSDFTLSGEPGETVTESAAVSLTVATNSVSGFALSAQATDPAMTPADPSNPDLIPVAHLGLRESEQGGAFQPLSAAEPVPLYSQPFPTDPTGDPVQSDYQIEIPSVIADTYSVTIEYIVIVQ